MPKTKLKKLPAKKPAAKKPSPKATQSKAAQSSALATRPSGDELVKEAASRELGPAASLANQALAHVVKDEGSLVIANATLGNLAASKRKLEEQRTFFTKPLREHVKRIEALFRPVLDQLEQADEELRQKVINFYDARKVEADKLAAESRAKAEAAANAGNETKAAEHALKAVEVQSDATVKTMVSDTAMVGVRTSWDFEVEDMGKVPAEYLTIDLKAVAAAVKSGVRDIPGIRVFEKTSLAVTPTSGASMQA